jgi:uncharacterized membrane protein
MSRFSRAVAAARGQQIDFRQALFCVYILVALLIFTFMVPPFQKSDEPAHYFRSISLTNLDLVCTPNADGEYRFEMKSKYAGFPQAINTWDVAFHPHTRFDRDWLNVDWSDPAWDETVEVFDVCNLPAFGYLPNMLGIFLGKPFENPMTGLYLGRVFGALFFVGALIWALRVTPEQYRLPLYFYAAMPTVLHQVSAVSYDAVQLSLFAVMYAYITRFAVEDTIIRPRT